MMTARLNFRCLKSCLTIVKNLGCERYSSCLFVGNGVSSLVNSRPYSLKHNLKKTIAAQFSHEGRIYSLSGATFLSQRWCGHECITHQECWKCGTAIEPDMEQYFCVCGVVQPPLQTRSYFQIFGIEESFDIDPKKLRTKYQKLQTLLHPDRYSQKCETEKEFSVQHSVMVNKAYWTLVSPLKRGLYMLRIKGVDIEKDVEVDMDFLMEAFELGEAVEDAASKEEIIKIDSENQRNIDYLVRRISNSFKSDDIAAAKQSLLKLQYLVTVSEKIQERLRNG